MMDTRRLARNSSFDTSRFFLSNSNHTFRYHSRTLLFLGILTCIFFVWSMATLAIYTSRRLIESWRSNRPISCHQS